MIELEYITKFYGDRKAERSGVPLINHIHEGLAVMREIGASDWAQRAYCLHPLFQADADLVKHAKQSLPGVPIQVMLLVMEYRNQANAWLSDKVFLESEEGHQRYGEICLIGKPSHGVLVATAEMLVADKVQNYYDFQNYHQGTHKRSNELGVYFETWLKELGIDVHDYLRLTKVIDADRKIRLMETPI